MMKTIRKIGDFLISELSNALIVGVSSQLTWKIISKCNYKKEMVWDLIRYIALIALLTANVRTAVKSFILRDVFVNIR